MTDRHAGRGTRGERAAPWVDYLFIFDQEKREVVASFYIQRPDMKPEDAPTDVSHGAVPVEHLDETMSVLRVRYPMGRYAFAGGWASSLASCVETFLGFEHDFDDL